jgi:hypothetical protein
MPDLKLAFLTVLFVLELSDFIPTHPPGNGGFGVPAAHPFSAHPRVLSHPHMGKPLNPPKVSVGLQRLALLELTVVRSCSPADRELFHLFVGQREFIVYLPKKKKKWLPARRRGLERAEGRLRECRRRWRAAGSTGTPDFASYVLIYCESLLSDKVFPDARAWAFPSCDNADQDCISGCGFRANLSDGTNRNLAPTSSPSDCRFQILAKFDVLAQPGYLCSFSTASQI